MPASKSKPSPAATRLAPPRDQCSPPQFKSPKSTTATTPSYVTFYLAKTPSFPPWATWPVPCQAQEALIKASTLAGVRRFIPSEFGSDTLNARVRSFPFFADKLRHQDILRRAAEKNSDFSYSLVNITGPFLDWGLSVVPFILDFGGRKGQGE